MFCAHFKVHPHRWQYISAAGGSCGSWVCGRHPMLCLPALTVTCSRRPCAPLAGVSRGTHVLVQLNAARCFVLRRGEGRDLIIVDTSGRHKQEESLFEEMRQVRACVIALARAHL